MNILYIDNRRYTYNASIHVDFFSSLQSKVGVVGLGDYLGDKLAKSYSSEANIPSILSRHKIDAIVSYNSGSNDRAKMSWVADRISKIDIPKFHITTDYCRRGFSKGQADWFNEVGYCHAFFRHKVSLKHPLNISKSWLPFSFDRGKYDKLSIKKVNYKLNKVAFAGAAHFSSKSLYSKRIAAIDYLGGQKLIVQPPMKTDSKGRMVRSRVVGEKYIKFYTENLFGLTCGGTCNFFVAKYIQIPAMHCMLICASTVGLEDYPVDTYIEYEVGNLDKLKRDIKYHIKNKSETREKIMILNSHVNKKHTHCQRGKEFVSLIKKYL